MDMRLQIANKASLAKIISYPTIGSGIIGLLKMPQNRDISSQLYFVRTKGLLQCTKNTSHLTCLHVCA